MTNKERLANLQARMRESGVDLAAIGSTANLHYFLGFAPHADERLCLLLVGNRDVRMVVPGLNREEIASNTDVELVPWADVDGPREALKNALAAWTIIRTLAVDGAIRADALMHLQASVTCDKIISTDALVAPLRWRKSAQEIDLLSRAAAQADHAMQAAVDTCRVGVTEAQVAWAAETAFRQDGAETVHFTLIASGPNGAFPHHHSGERRLQKGDAIIMDIGASFRGYNSDITRMVYLGKPSSEFAQAYAAVLDANQRAIAAVRPGIAAEEIDHIARGTLQAAGYGQYFTHRAGHGIGLEGHELPWIMNGNKTLLQEGMVFSVEPGVYFVDKFGVRVEDIVAVTQAGVRNLTGFDHALVIKE